MFSEQKIIELFEKHWNSVDLKDINKIFKTEGGISALEGVLLYLYIIDTRPRSIIEFSPNKGYSSFAIASAQRLMRNRWAFATFEIKDKFCNATKAVLQNNNLLDYCEVICGDALRKVPIHIESKGAHVDLCFIDSDHGEEFAQQYIDKLFPLFKPDCLIAVHDIAGKKRLKSGKTEFKTSLMGGAHKGGEEHSIRKFLKKNKKDYTVLHSVTGGKHEGANLPINNDLYEKILNISGYDFRKSKSPPCPKTLFFKL